MNKIKFLLAFIFLLTQSCDTTEPNNNDITLAVEEVSSTEVWLNLNVSNINLPVNVNILQDNQPVTQIMNLSKQDTILSIDSLLPGRNYNFKAQISDAVSNNVTAITMDTTSNNFEWELYTFGENIAASSHLSDVVIIDENNIWAVGEIYMNDSLGNPDPHLYNLIKWDGVKWNLERIYFENSGGQTFLAPITSIFAFNEIDVWLGLDQIIRWDGTTYKSTEIPDQIFLNWINKIWGSNSSNLYIVGNGGNIAHFDGTSWQKLESGTNENLYSISGNENSTIYSAGGKVAQLTGVLVRGNNMDFEIEKEGISLNSEADLFNPYFAGTLTSVWVSQQNGVYFGGHFLYRFKHKKWELVRGLEGNYFKGNSSAQHWGFILDIEGTNENDIFMVGERNTLRHFNGSTWKQLGIPYSASSDIAWRNVSIKDNIVVTVGSKANKASIMVLKR